MGRDLKLTLLSRRRSGMAGTRFNARGIDEDGNVANFVESEVMINFKDDDVVCSHIQIRGSVPLFWSQKSKNNKVKIKDHKKTEPAFDKHFQDILQEYSQIFFLNLLAGEGHELKLSNLVQYQINKRTKQDKVRYMSYDFHKWTANGNFDDPLFKLI